MTDAKGQPTELVRHAEAGDDIILTKYGQPAVHLVPIKLRADPKTRRKLLQAIRASGSAKAHAGDSAARSQDFLYSANGLPR